MTILLGITGTAAAAPVTAITLSAGDSAILNFDFVAAGVVPAPPYTKILLTASFADLDSGDSGTIKFWSDLDASGTNFQTLNNLELLLGTIFEDVPLANDGMFSLTITMIAGSITLFDPAARGFDAEGADTPSVFGVEVQQVPEPATIMLLGLGLAGVTVRRRRAVARRSSRV